MAKKGSTELGKAFEYACILSLYNRYRLEQNVHMNVTDSFRTAQKNFYHADSRMQQDLLHAAYAAINVIERLEPRLPYPDDDAQLTLHLQSDAAGMSGDVRDILCIRRIGHWEIGISCKHNHYAVKHSRLSDQIDFGNEWFGIGCSRRYFSEVVPLFTRLREIRDSSRAQGNPALWKEMPDKAERCYRPVLQSFIDELKRLDEQHKNIPELLVRYLIGKRDFYKVITNDAKRYTRIEAINIEGTLNKSSAQHAAMVHVPALRLPTRFYSVDFKIGSNNTVLVACDCGWEISMRLHNASSKVEPSLKFDVQLESMPSSIYSESEPWDAEQVKRMAAESHVPYGDA